MSSDLQSIQVSSGESIELEWIPAKENFSEAKTFLFLPCITGNFRTYKIPKTQIWEKGLNVLLVNPRGHGNSSGTYHSEKSVEDILEILHVLKLDFSKLIGFGHSGGGATILKLSAKIFLETKVSIPVFLCSPILDSALSLKFLYESQNISEFFLSFLKSEEDFGSLPKFLRDPDWLNPTVWRDHDYRSICNGGKLNFRTPNFLLGDWLENLFIPTRNCVLDLEQKNKNSVLFLPKEDIWFHTEFTLEQAEKRDWRIEIVEMATNHFFKGGWEFVWNEVLSELDSVSSQKI